AARCGRERGAEALADALGDRVALEHVDAVEDVAGGRVHAQVRGHQVEGARPHGAVEAQDLAEHAPDGRVALGDLHDRVDVLVVRHVTFAPGGRSRSSERTDSFPPIDAASTMPFDSMPISFAASRLATMTTFLPTRSAGA